MRGRSGKEKHHADRGFNLEQILRELRSDVDPTGRQFHRHLGEVEPEPLVFEFASVRGVARHVLPDVERDSG